MSLNSLVIGLQRPLNLIKNDMCRYALIFTQFTKFMNSNL